MFRKEDQHTLLSCNFQRQQKSTTRAYLYCNKNLSANLFRKKYFKSEPWIKHLQELATKAVLLTFGSSSGTEYFLSFVANYLGPSLIT